MNSSKKEILIDIIKRIHPQSNLNELQFAIQ